MPPSSQGQRIQDSPMMYSDVQMSKDPDKYTDTEEGQGKVHS